MPPTIPINPKLPANFDSTPNADRDEDEVRQWWCRPFVVGAADQWTVRCLDGGAWDRSTFHGSFDTQAAAVAFATRMHELLWNCRSSNELPMPYPYEQQLTPPEGQPQILAAKLIGAAQFYQALKAELQPK